MMKDDFERRIERLNAVLHDAEDLFLATFTVAANVPLSTGQFVFRRGLFVQGGDGTELALLHTSALTRVEAAFALQRLWETCVGASQKALVDIESATTEARGFLDRHPAGMSEADSWSRT